MASSEESMPMDGLDLSCESTDSDQSEVAEVERLEQDHHHDDFSSLRLQHLTLLPDASFGTERINSTPASASPSQAGSTLPEPIDDSRPPTPPPPAPPTHPLLFPILLPLIPSQQFPTLPSPPRATAPDPVISRPSFFYLDNETQVLGLPVPLPDVDAKPAPVGPFVCPICLDPIAQTPADILSHYSALSALLARADVPDAGGPRSVDFREILGHCEGRAPGHAVTTPCGHVYHAGCLSLSLAHAAAAELDGAALLCPLCRTSLHVRVVQGEAPPCLHGSTGAVAGSVDPASTGAAGGGWPQRFFYVRGRFVTLEALRLRVRRPRQRREWWWAAAAAASTALAAVGLVLLVLKFGFPGRVSWL